MFPFLKLLLMIQMCISLGNCSSCGDITPSVSNTVKYVRGSTDVNLKPVQSGIRVQDSGHCAMLCSASYDSEQGCSAFTADENNCSLYLLQNEAISKPEVAQTEIYYNYNLKNPLVNYRFLHQLSTFEFNIFGHGKGNGLRCPGVMANSLKNLQTPTGVTGIAHHGLGYDFRTSTLLVCGGLLNGACYNCNPTNQCYYNQLNSGNPWQSQLTMSIPRKNNILVGMNKKIFIFGGFAASWIVQHYSVEVFDVVDLTIKLLSNVSLPTLGFGDLVGTCTVQLFEENSIAFIGGRIANGAVYISNAAIFNANTSSWQSMTDMPTTRANHGCNRVTMNGHKYLMVFGGYSSANGQYSDILFYNMNTKVWSNLATYVKMSGTFGNIRSSIVTQLDYNGCNMMFIEANTNTLQICIGNYTWKSFSTAGLITSGNPYTTVGANDMIPCGVN